ncbi:VOC family protein [Lysinibacillus sp. 54212]|uniref:VOC family protein n=1 Tax=Lysinibacillus sp. 54212 TaxID=3119829 RepID=UPI002FCC94F7
MSTHFHQKPNLYTSHVQLKVSNLARSIEYYTTIIGFDILEQRNNTVYLTTDGKRSLVSLVEVTNAQPLSMGHTGLYHFALLLPSRKDLGNIVQHFVQHNVRLGASNHDVSEALYLSDPDGNGIEIYVDRPENEWTWSKEGYVHMLTEQLNFQPILAEADGEWNGLPKGTVMGHIHLSVRDLGATEVFYTNILDYEAVARYGAQALFISTGKYHHHIGLNTWQSGGGTPAPAEAVGLKYYTIVLKDTDYADEVKAALQNSGAVVEYFDEAPGYGGKQVFSTIDPNGIRIVFTVEGE